MRETLSVIRSEREGSIPVVRKAVRCHQNHRFFTLCHRSASRLSHKAFLPPFRMTTDDKRHPEAMSKTCCCDEEDHKTSSGESVTVVRKVVRCHQSHRFFTRCHVAVSRFSHKAFLRPFRMTIEGRR